MRTLNTVHVHVQTVSGGIRFESRWNCRRAHSSNLYSIPTAYISTARALHSWTVMCCLGLTTFWSIVRPGVVTMFWELADFHIPASPTSMVLSDSCILKPTVGLWKLLYNSIFSPLPSMRSYFLQLYYSFRLIFIVFRQYILKFPIPYHVADFLIMEL